MDVASYVQKFIQLSFPSNTEEVTIQNYKTYLMKVLNARLCSPIMDEQEISSELARLKNTTSAYRLQDCITRLSRQKLKRKNELLHFLFRVGQFSNKEQNQTIDVLFTTQDVSTSQISNSQLTQIKRSMMEVEQPASTRRQDVPEAMLNLIHQIADKGNASLSISESDLIKDLVFCIQGIEGTFITYDPISDSFIVKKDVALTQPARRLINQMCESGWLFKRISQFQNMQSSSLVIQALQNANKEELNEYFRLIAYFEGLIQTDGLQQLTLRKMYMWLKQPMHYLTQINLVLSTIQTNTQTTSYLGSTSALVLTTLFQFSKHGCPTTAELFKRQLQATCLPLLRFINQWVFDGSFDDVANEFFVMREETKVPIKDSGELWKREFKVDQDKIPCFINLEDAYKIFDTGRVINWLRKQCQYRKWHLDQELATIDMLQTPQFSEWVKKANEATNKELVSLVFNQFKFTLHLNAIKRYLLLGQGEFIHTLMEILQTELSKPAIQVYKHTLLGLLESAIRSSNISYLPQEVGLRLNVKILEPSKDDTGWEVFCIDYQIDEPLNTIFNGRVMLYYYRIFNFLWRVKRVEYTLTQCWKSHAKFMNIPRELHELRKAMQLSYQMMNEMQHFIKNFYSYIMLEAVESAWKKFLDDLERIKDLESLIKLHEVFQNEILERSFLTQKHEQIQKLVLKLFEYIFRFKQMQETLMSTTKDAIYNFKSEEKKNSTSLKNIIENKSMQNLKNNAQLEFAQVTRVLLELRKQYRESMFELLEKLKREDRLKFLHFKLDFNEYYQTIKDSKLFDGDLEKFIEKIQKNDNTGRVHSSRQLGSAQKNTHIQAAQSPGHAQGQRANTTIIQKDFAEQVKNIKEGLKSLDEQKKLMLQQKEQSKERLSNLQPYQQMQLPQQTLQSPSPQLPPKAQQPSTGRQQLNMPLQQLQQSQQQMQKGFQQPPSYGNPSQSYQRNSLTDYEKKKNEEFYNDDEDEYLVRGDEDSKYFKDDNDDDGLD